MHAMRTHVRTISYTGALYTPSYLWFYYRIQLCMDTSIQKGFISNFLTFQNIFILFLEFWKRPFPLTLHLLSCWNLNTFEHLTAA